MVTVLLAVVLSGCSTPLAHRGWQKRRIPARSGGQARLDTGRLTEEDLGIHKSEQPVDPDAIPIPLELGRSHPKQAAALRLSEQARKLLRQGRGTQRAIRLLEQAIGLDSHTPYAYYLLGEAYFRLGSSKQAQAFLERAASLLGGNRRWGSKVWGLRGLVWESEGERDKALEAYEHAVELWPQNLTAVAGRARLGGSMRE